MNQESGTIKSFTKLNAWTEGHKLVLMVYKLTIFFPKEELSCRSLQILQKGLGEGRIKKK